VALVLCTGIDPELLASRKLILEGDGHTVVSTMDQRELEKACAEQNFDIAIIGEAMSPKVKRWASQLIREKCPSSRMLELYPFYAGRSLTDVDAWLAMPREHPEEFKEVVNSLAPQRR
jgi:hypothetical protein